MVPWLCARISAIASIVGDPRSGAGRRLRLPYQALSVGMGSLISMLLAFRARLLKQIPQSVVDVARRGFLPFCIHFGNVRELITGSRKDLDDVVVDRASDKSIARFHKVTRAFRESLYFASLESPHTTDFDRVQGLRSC